MNINIYTNLLVKYGSTNAIQLDAKGYLFNNADKQNPVTIRTKLNQQTNIGFSKLHDSFPVTQVS